VVVRQLDTVLDGNSENLAYVLQHAPATILHLRTVVAASDQLTQGISPGPTQALMVAVIETKSAFSYADANGHYVRVLALPTANRAGYSGSGTGSGAGGTSVPAGTASDQQLVNLLMSGASGP